MSIGGIGGGLPLSTYLAWVIKAALINKINFLKFQKLFSSLTMTDMHRMAAKLNFLRLFYTVRHLVTHNAEKICKLINLNESLKL